MIRSNKVHLLTLKHVMRATNRGDVPQAYLAHKRESCSNYGNKDHWSGNLKRSLAQHESRSGSLNKYLQLHLEYDLGMTDALFIIALK